MMRNTVIESLGVYLPPKKMSTEDVVKGCRRPVRFPLERMTGIKSRRVAGGTEFSIDLARQAITRCLAISRFDPDDIDIVISTSVACDGPSLWLSHEPSTALRLKAQCGFSNALTFDFASACSGMFAAINIVDALLKTGRIGCGLVVSGEYISHLTETAQKEIDSLLDSRLACLTLGDAGAAVLLTTSPNPGVGFDALDLCTISSCAEYCVAGPTREAHGGGIMHTDALKMTEAATRYGSIHALETMEQAGWSMTDFQHLIMHQTSRTALTSAMREINRLMKRPVCHKGNTIDNLTARGNTASTTHFVAVADNIQNNRIRSGDKIIFAISGSGLTIGTALYTFDDLPDRLRGNMEGASSPVPGEADTNGSSREPNQARVRIRSAGLTPLAKAPGNDSMDLLKAAATDCLKSGHCGPDDIDLLIHAGMYRTGFTVEPAIAALLAGQMKMNSTLAAGGEGRRMLAFDVLNGSIGFLNACYVAVEMIRAGKSSRAMIVTAEVENNARHFSDDLLGLQEAGAGLIIEDAPDEGGGFGGFLFRDFTEHVDLFYSRCINKEGKAYLLFGKDPALEQHYVRCIAAVVAEFLDTEGLSLSQIARIFPPQISSAFIEELRAALGVSPGKVVDVVNGGGDLYSSSLPFALQPSLGGEPAREGDIGLIIAVGSGIQVGCASYHF